MNNIYITLVCLIVLVVCYLYFKYKFNKLKDELKNFKQNIEPNNLLDEFKDIKVFVNNNPDKNSFDYLYKGEGLSYCLVLDITKRTLSLVEPGRERILANNIKLNTVKKEVKTQEMSVVFIDGSIKGFKDSNEEFSFKDLMKWYYSKQSDVFELKHSNGFVTLRRDLIKHIEFKRI
jgi:hypothetical protein